MENQKMKNDCLEAIGLRWTFFAKPENEKSYRLAYVNSLLEKGVPAYLCAHLAGRRRLVSIIKNEDKNWK